MALRSGNEQQLSWKGKEMRKGSARVRDSADAVRNFFQTGACVYHTHVVFSSWKEISRIENARKGYFEAIFYRFLSIFFPKKCLKLKEHIEYSTYCPKYISNMIICIGKIGYKVRKKQFFAFS